jgi:hypothetical protein
MSAPTEEKLHREWPHWYVELVRRYYPRAVFMKWLESETREAVSYTNALLLAFRGAPPITGYIH